MRYANQSIMRYAYATLCDKEFTFHTLRYRYATNQRLQQGCYARTLPVSSYMTYIRMPSLAKPSHATHVHAPNSE